MTCFGKTDKTTLLCVGKADKIGQIIVVKADNACYNISITVYRRKYYAPKKNPERD